MLGVSGVVPDGVAAAYLTAPDGTAVRADVADNAYAFVVPAPRDPGQRYVVWTGGDGTPHVQPVPRLLLRPRAERLRHALRERRAGHARGGRLPGRCDRGGSGAACPAQPASCTAGAGAGSSTPVAPCVALPVPVPVP